MTTSKEKESSKKTSDEIQKGVKNHKKIAHHLDAAAKLHLDAAKHHEDGEHKKAAQSTIAAQGFLILANEAQQEDVKHHALND